MKTTPSYRGSRPSGFFLFLLSVTLWNLHGSAWGQLYVGQQGGGSGSVGEYNSHNGAPIAPNLITSGVQNPQGLAVMGNTLFVANQYTSSVGEYDASTGIAISTTFIPGLSDPGGLALSGSTLFVVCGNNAVGEYNALTGQAINADLFYGLSDGLNNPAGLLLAGNILYVTNDANTFAGTGYVSEYNVLTDTLLSANFITNLSNPQGLALSGTNLLVANEGSNTVGEYDAATGGTNSASFITSGLSQPFGLLVQGNDLLVANGGSNIVDEYDATTATELNPDFVTGVSQPVSLAVAVPEPSVSVLMGLGILALTGIGHRQTRVSRRRVKIAAPPAPTQ